MATIENSMAITAASRARPAQRSSEKKYGWASRQMVASVESRRDTGFLLSAGRLDLPLHRPSRIRARVSLAEVVGADLLYRAPKSATFSTGAGQPAGHRHLSAVQRGAASRPAGGETIRALWKADGTPYKLRTDRNRDLSRRFVYTKRLREGREETREPRRAMPMTTESDARPSPRPGANFWPAPPSPARRRSPCRRYRAPRRRP